MLPRGGEERRVAGLVVSGRAWGGASGMKILVALSGWGVLAMREALSGRPAVARKPALISGWRELGCSTPRPFSFCAGTFSVLALAT